MATMVTDLIALLSSLVAVDSVNPSLVTGGAGEGEIATLVQGWGATLGLLPSVWRRRPAGRAC